MHGKLGHAGDDLTRITAKQLRYELAGKPMKCESFAMGKSKQNLLNKTTKSDRM